MKAFLNLLVLVLMISPTLKAQESQTPSIDSLNKSLTAIKKDIDVLKRLKVNGWIQAQYQHADSAGVANLDGGDLPAFQGKKQIF
jgi:hypothetical protein